MSTTGSQRAHTATWTHGRPVRGHSGRLLLPAVDPARPDGIPPAAVAWVEAARHEFSSVASFYIVGTSLVALGAPHELVDRALQAADDEHHHVEICLALARRSGAGDPRIVDQVCDLTRHRRRPDNLVDTAISALLDGVVGEGFAARRLELTTERSPALAAALGRLAADERDHVDLAIDIVSWCISVRPWIDADLARALDTVSRAAPRSPVLDAVPDAERPHHGLCGDADSQTAWSDALDAAHRLVEGVRSAVG